MCLPRWRKWVVLIALVCAIGLYTDAVTHHHHTLAQQMGCPVCHAVGHNPLSVFTPTLAAPAQVFSWFASTRPRVRADGFRRVLDPSHRSRAPPLVTPTAV